MNTNKSIVITDLDNTLFDWFEIWYRPFKAMLDELIVKSGLSQELLEREFREVFQKHGTSEYAFAIEELPSLRKAHPGEDPTKLYEKAIDRYREARTEVLQLYPTVRESLEVLKAKGCLLIAYTESSAFYTRYRVKKLGLDRLIDYLYSPADHNLPNGRTPEQIRMYPPEHYQLEHVVQRYTPSGELKPNPEILAQIISDSDGRKEDTIYVGDSLMKDMVMAQSAGVADVHAKYGEAQSRPEYDLLRRVSHWKQETVDYEKTLTEKDIKPTFTLAKSFSELLTLFEFGGVHANVGRSD